LIKENIMSKLSLQAKVYTALSTAGLGVPVSVGSLLGIEGVLPYKLSAYVLYAKIDYGAVIVPVRVGRQVTAYRMTNLGQGLPVAGAAKVAKIKSIKAPKVPKSPPVAKVAKAPKPAVVKAVKTVKAPKRIVTAEMMTDDRIVDVLDDIMGDIQYSEDRAFARSYVASM
jgi:hypothetical protein